MIEPQHHDADLPIAAQGVKTKGARRLAWMGLAIPGVLLCLIVGLLAGLAWFVLLLPNNEVALSRRADGIVVLTGGASRVSDAMDLLASGHGLRLLISGVHPLSGRASISRTLPEHVRMLDCCVDLDRSALNTYGNAIETERWARARGFRSLIVVTSNYHMPRALAEIAHRMPDVELVPYPVVAEKWRNEPWWVSGATFRLLLSEYVKFVVAKLRMRLSDAGLISERTVARWGWMGQAAQAEAGARR